MSKQINLDYAGRSWQNKLQLEQINPLGFHLEREKKRKAERATKTLSRLIYFPKPVEFSELECANLAKAAFESHRRKHLTE